MPILNDIYSGHKPFRPPLKTISAILNTNTSRLSSIQMPRKYFFVFILSAVINH